MLEWEILGIYAISETQFISIKLRSATLLPAEGDLQEASSRELTAPGEAFPSPDASAVLLLRWTGRPPAQDGGGWPDATPRPGLRPSRPPRLRAGARPPPRRSGRRVPGPSRRLAGRRRSQPEPCQPRGGPSRGGPRERGDHPRREEAAGRRGAGCRLPVPARRRARAPTAPAAARAPSPPQHSRSPTRAAAAAAPARALPLRHVTRPPLSGEGGGFQPCPPCYPRPRMRRQASGPPRASSIGEAGGVLGGGGSVAPAAALRGSRWRGTLLLTRSSRARAVARPRGGRPTPGPVPLAPGFCPVAQKGAAQEWARASC